MGQSYSVNASFKFKNDDPTLFCSIIEKEIMMRNGITARFDLHDEDLKTPFGCFQALTTREARNDSDSGIWYADFDGSYGWEMVMYDIFKAAAKALDNGSYVFIYPDSGITKIIVEDGKIVTSYELLRPMNDEK